MPPAACTKRRGVGLQLLAERVVGGEEVPGIAARLHHRAAGRFRQHVGVVGPVDEVGRAGLAGQVGRSGAGVEVDLVLLAHDRLHGERDRRCRHVEQHVHAVAVEPLARDRHGEVGLVLVIGVDHLDVEAFAGDAEILQRLLAADDRGRAAGVHVRARHVVQHADLDGRRALRAGTHKRHGGRGSCGAEESAAGDGHGRYPYQWWIGFPSVVELHRSRLFPSSQSCQTPRYSCILSMLASSRWFGIMSITWPCSMT